MSKKLDKSTWAKGVWDNEPDSLEGIDDATGYPVQILRNAIGALCGYVVIPKDHPYFTNDKPVDVHGGITFEQDLFEDDRVMLGFDCSHVGDSSPAMEYLGIGTQSNVYRDIDYVKSQVASLAKQLKEME